MSCMYEQEAPQRAFTKKIWGLRETPYWQRLRELRPLSTERRQERYRVIYLFKILMGQAPNCGVVEAPQNSRRGRTVLIPPLRGSWARIRTLKEASFQQEAPRLYNSLPRLVREAPDLPSFKALLDAFLQELPDQPGGPGSPPGATTHEGRPSNSFRDWARTRPELRDWTPSEPLPLSWIDRNRQYNL